MFKKCSISAEAFGVTLLLVAGCSMPPSSNTVSAVKAVKVACSPASIESNQSTRCTATVTGTGSYSTAVGWITTNGSIAITGVFTPSVAGTSTITATSTQDVTKFGSTVVTVTPQSGMAPTLVGPGTGTDTNYRVATLTPIMQWSGSGPETYELTITKSRMPPRMSYTTKRESLRVPAA